MNQGLKSTACCAELLANFVLRTRAAPCATERETAAFIAGISSRALPPSDAKRSATALRVKPVNAARATRLKAQYRIRNFLMRHYDQTRCVTVFEAVAARLSFVRNITGSEAAIFLSAPLVVRPC
jgi:hypothetical protein